MRIQQKAISEGWRVQLVDDALGIIETSDALTRPTALTKLRFKLEKDKLDIQRKINVIQREALDAAWARFNGDSRFEEASHRLLLEQRDQLHSLNEQYTELEARRICVKEALYKLLYTMR